MGQIEISYHLIGGNKKHTHHFYAIPAPKMHNLEFNHEETQTEGHSTK